MRDQIRDIFSVFSNAPNALRLVRQSAPLHAILMSLLTVIQSLFPLAKVWIGKLIVDGVVHAIDTGGVSQDVRRILLLVGLEFGIVVAQSLVSHITQMIQEIVRNRLTNHINLLILQQAIRLDMAFYENPTFYDKLQRAQREAGHRPMALLQQLSELARNVLTLTSLLGLLFRFDWRVVVVLFLTTIPHIFVQMKYSYRSYRMLYHRAQPGRKAGYLGLLLTNNRFAKEIRLFGLGEHLLSRYKELIHKFYRENVNLAFRRNVAVFLFNLLSTGGFYGSYVYIVYRTILRAITLGDMTMYAGAFGGSQGCIRGILTSISGMYEGNLFLSNLFDFLALKPEIEMCLPDKKSYVAQAEAKLIPKALRRGIEFRDVSFRYPGMDKLVLEGVSFTVAPGEKIALVGENGAGKTTLVKLLTRLYDPTRGEIRIDGVDLRELDLDSLRSSIGVLFQDYAQYYLTARENIGFGRIEELEDLEKIRRSARRADAHEMVEELSEGYETVLGRWFEGGQELSVGQWQRIALARAVMRGGEILVLDEPTAALDVETEYDLFRRFSQLTDGKVVILISHRFSTVRMADRILVLHGGRIVEKGSHEELMRLGGRYAHLFTMQAERYR